jgi:RNA recognition motif-containing protein
MSEDHEGRRQAVPSTISTVRQDNETGIANSSGVNLNMAAVMSSVLTDKTGYDMSGPYVQGYSTDMFYKSSGEGVGPPVKVADIENHGDSFVDGSQQQEEEVGSSEESPLKLFVGQVPRSMAEEDLFPTFAEYGPIKELMIIRDKHTGQHRGCAFVTFFKIPDGERAAEELHDQVTLPSGRKPLQVRPANENSSVTTPVQENKLFVGMTSRNADESSLRELFSPFGEIREIYIIRNSDGSNKGCAFLKFSQSESAMAAIESLNDKVVMEGATRPLIVKYADTRAQRRARHGGGRAAHHQYYGPGIPMYPGFHQVRN